MSKRLIDCYMTCHDIFESNFRQRICTRDFHIRTCISQIVDDEFRVLRDECN